MDKIWSISEGEYSSYHTVAFFPSRELAEAALDAGVGSDEYSRPFIEEHYFFDSVPESKEQLHLTAAFNRVFGRHPNYHVENPWGLVESERTERSFFSKNAYVQEMNNNWLTVYGSDFAKVRKIYSDMLARWKVEHEMRNPDG